MHGGSSSASGKAQLIRNVDLQTAHLSCPASSRFGAVTFLLHSEDAGLPPLLHAQGRWNLLGGAALLAAAISTIVLLHRRSTLSTNIDALSNSLHTLLYKSNPCFSSCNAECVIKNAKLAPCHGISSILEESTPLNLFSSLTCPCPLATIRRSTRGYTATCHNKEEHLVCPPYVDKREPIQTPTNVDPFSNPVPTFEVLHPQHFPHSPIEEPLEFPILPSQRVSNSATNKQKLALPILDGFGHPLISDKSPKLMTLVCSNSIQLKWAMVRKDLFFLLGMLSFFLFTFVYKEVTSTGVKQSEPFLVYRLFPSS